MKKNVIFDLLPINENIKLIVKTDSNRNRYYDDAEAESILRIYLSKSNSLRQFSEQIDFFFFDISVENSIVLSKNIITFLYCHLRFRRKHRIMMLTNTLLNGI